MPKSEIALSVMVAAACSRDANRFVVHGPGVLVKVVQRMEANEVQSESWFQANPIHGSSFAA